MKTTLRPLIDAGIIASIVFVSFLLSATIVIWDGELKSIKHTSHHLASAAWRTSWAAVKSQSDEGQINSKDLVAELRQILAEEPAIKSLAVLAHTENGVEVVIVEGDAQFLVDREIFLTEDTGLPGRFLNAPLHDILRSGAPVVYVPAGTQEPHFVRVEGHLPKSNLRKILTPVVGIALAVAGLVGFLVHTSSRKFHSAFQKLSKAESRMRDVIDAAGEYIWEVNNTGHYTFLSDRVRDVLGFSPMELVGRHPFEFLSENNSATIRSRSEYIVRNAKPFRDFEHHMKRKDGTTIWLSVNGVPVLDKEGRLTGYRGAAMDITDRKLGEQALIREKDSAQSAAIAKSQFLAMMSHEIRTPLNSVLGFTDLLANSKLDPSQREHLKMIRKSGSGLLELLNDILEFSRAETGSLTTKVEPTNIREFLRDVMALHQPLAQSKNIQLTVDVKKEVPEWLGVDQARLRQILINLTGNAVKFTTAGSISISAFRGQHAMDGKKFPLIIRVCDTGIGIPNEKQGLLFKPFSQVDSSATRRFGGTGLGLAICDRLANFLGGRVFLEHSSPEGSTFSFECDFMILKPAESALAIPKPMHPEGPHTWQVLVAEDNPASRKLMQIMLSKVGLPIQTASDGGEAVAKHCATPFDIIFMDLQMPVMDGISATREIRELERLGKLSKRAHIVALTADALSGDRERCISAGMDDYLSKPVNKEALVSLFARFSPPNPA